MANYKPCRISDLLSEFITEINAEQILEILIHFISEGYIIVKKNGATLEINTVKGIFERVPNLMQIIDLELGAPNAEKFLEIKKLLKYYRFINWLKESTILTWKFIWKHFIVTIIVSALTAYIITRFITQT